MSSLSDRERAIRTKLRDDFPHYAAKCLRIRTKSGAIEPLILNSAQRFIHGACEEQLARTGRVRKLVLKGRQQGCSTYVEARYYHRTTHRRGIRAFILTHEQKATDNLFEMVARFHENTPDLVRPKLGSANAKELSFPLLDSDYQVGTAGQKGTGRSQTIQLFHGSEVGYWPNAATHAAGVLQAIPNEPGTEVILESTGNGLGNFFHHAWEAAVRGEGDFEAIFVPWFWQEEYRREPAADFKATPDELELMEVHKLDLSQVAWRRTKISELGSEPMFKQEYPSTPEEAFQSDTAQTIMPIALVRGAVGRDVKQIPGRMIWGVDVAMSHDRSSLAKRRTNRLQAPVKWWPKLDTMQLAGAILADFRETPKDDRPDTIVVDAIGIGAGVAHRLQEMGLPAVALNVSESLAADAAYPRVRDEMWFNARQWFEDRATCMPDDGALIAELTTVEWHYTSSGKRQVESKEKMKERGLRSPDLADAFVMTFTVSDLPSGRGRAAEPPTFADGV